MREASGSLRSLMTIDLISLLFLVLLALVSDVRFGTPDPTEDFLERFANCISPEIMRSQSEAIGATEPSSQCGEEVSKIASTSLSGPNPPLYEVCQRAAQPRNIKGVPECSDDKLHPSPSNGNESDRPMVLIVDLDEGVIRLPEIFDVRQEEPNNVQRRYIEHVSAVLGGMLGQHAMPDGGRFHLSDRLTNSELLLVVVEGHSDHQVSRENGPSDTNPTQSLSGSELDNNVRLGMRRARYFVLEILKQSTDLDIPVVPSSLGCHRPYEAIGPIEQTIGENGEQRYRHDLACFQLPAESEWDSRRYVRPVGIAERGTPPLLTGSQQHIQDRLAINRRVEIRPIFRLQRSRTHE